MKTFTPFLFIITFLIVFVGGNIYLSRRLAYFFNIENIKYLYLLFGILTVLMIGGISGFTNSTKTFGSLVYISATIVTGVLLYLLLSTIIADIFYLIFKGQPKIYGLSIVSFTFLISLFGIINAFNVRTTQTQIYIKNLNTDLNIVHLTDIHLGHFRSKNFVEKIVTKTNELHPDIIFITGDLFDGKINLKPETIEPMQNFNAPVYFVDGNHDGYSGVELAKQYARQNGLLVLENDLIELDNIQIIGLNHMKVDDKTPDIHAQNQNTIKNVLDSIETISNKPIILLHHSPTGIDYAAQKGVDLFLAGHTHGGQMFPVNIFVRLMYPFNSGLYNYKGTQIFVSDGVGTFGPPFRIGTKSEIALLKLIPEDEK